MNTLKIKVIKKNSLINYKIPVVAEQKTKQNAEREVATNISGWVKDFQHRRREESKIAFNQLFAACG